MSKGKTVVLALFTMLLWGSLFPTVKLGFSAYQVKGTADILLFAGIRFAICGAIICILSYSKDKASYKNVKSSILPILLSGAFAIILHYTFTYIGLETTESSKTALIKQVGPLLYVCFSFLFIKDDKPTAKKIIAAIIGFLGIIVMNITSSGISFLIGDVLIFCASLCSVISNIISKKLFERVDPITATGVSQLFGGAVLLLIGTLMGGKVNFAFDASLLIMLYICIASIASYCIWYMTIKSSDLSNLFIIKFAEPVFAALLGAVILQENIFKIQYLIAFLMIGGSIFISNTKFHQKTRFNQLNTRQKTRSNTNIVCVGSCFYLLINICVQ